MIECVLGDREEMHEVIQQNYASILAMIFLVIFSLMNSNFEQDTNNKFINMAILNVILIGMEAYQEELSDALYVKETLLTFTHIIRASFPYLFVLMIYTTTTFQEIIISIPSILNTVYLLFNLSRKNLIFVSEKNIVYLPFVVGVFYAIYLIYLTYRKLNQKNYYESILIIISCAICILAAFLESTFSYKSILTTSYSLSVIFFYLFYHTNQNNCDVLTGTYIRRRFFIDAKKMKNT